MHVTGHIAIVFGGGVRTGLVIKTIRIGQLKMNDFALISLFEKENSEEGLKRECI